MQILPKTFEYPYPSPIPSDWLKTANRIWNDALNLLEQRQYWVRLQKCAEVESDWCDWPILPIAIDYTKPSGQDSWGLCCALGRDQRIDRKKSWDKLNIEFRECRNIVPTDWLKEPVIDGFSDISLKKPFTAKRGYDVGSMPTGLVQNLIKALAESWKLYQKGQKGKPRYRFRKNPVKTLSYDGFRHFCKLSDNGQVKLLGMPGAKVKGIESLLPLIEKTAQYLKENPTDKVLKKAETIGIDAAAEFYAIPGAYALVQCSGKTYLQISGLFAISAQSATAKPIEITTGTEHLWSDGVAIIEHENNTAYEKRLVALQRRLSAAKFGSNNWVGIKSKIGKLQELIKKRTRRHQQYHAQLLANHKQVKILPYVPTIIPAPIPVPSKDGNRYLPNGATAIAEQNQKRAKAATAQFIGLIKEKAKETGAEFIDNRKGNELELESQEIDRRAEPQADVKQPKSSEHGQSRKRQQGRKEKSNSQILQNAKPKTGRNRKRERAIG